MPRCSATKLLVRWRSAQPYPDQTKRGLVCVTETMPRSEIERLVACIKRILETPV